MAKPVTTFYVFHGDDEFSSRAQLDTMRNQMGDPATADLNTARLDGKNVSAADVIAAASAVPFLSDRRLVIVDGMLSWLSRKGGGKNAKAETDVLVEALPTLPDFARVVFFETQTLSDRNAVLQLARNDAHGYHKAFNPPRNPTAWIKKQANTVYEVEIDPQAAMALAAVIGDDLRAADNELAKLAAFVDGARPIVEQDVALLTTYAAEADVFEMVDALGRRDGAAATQLLHRLLEQDEALRLFGMIVRQFRLLLQAREYLNNGGAPQEMPKAIGVHPYVAQKLTGQVRAFTLDQLEKIYRFLLETDVSIKTGKVDAEIALDLFIAGIAQ